MYFRQFVLAALIGATPLQAQDTLRPPMDFMKGLREIAKPAGRANVGVACGGLFRAVSILFDKESDNHKRLSSSGTDLTLFAATLRERESGESFPASVDFVSSYITRVDQYYQRRFRANIASGNKPLDEVVFSMIDYCGEIRTLYKMNENLIRQKSE